MNYLLNYIKLCKRAKQRTHDSCIHEKHHVFPESMFGKNKFTVSLTLREHFIAHIMLVRIISNRYGKEHPFYLSSLRAVFVMSVNGKGKTNSRIYEAFRKDYVEAMRGKNWGYSTEKKSQLMTDDNPMHRPGIANKVSNTIKQHWRDGKYDNSFTAERNEKIRQSKVGPKNPMYGNTSAADHMHSKSYTCRYCDIITTKGNISRWHNDKCKLNPAHL